MAFYLAVNAVIGLYRTYFVSLAGMPLMLRMNEVIEECVSNYILRILIASFFGSIILYVLEIFRHAQCDQCGMLIVVSTQYSPMQLACFLVVNVIFQFAFLWALFVKRQADTAVIRTMRSTEKPVRVGFVQPLNSHSIGWTTTGRYVWMGYVVLLADTCLLSLKHPVTLFGISEIFHEVSDAKLIQRPKKVLFEVWSIKIGLPVRWSKIWLFRVRGIYYL